MMGVTRNPHWGNLFFMGFSAAWMIVYATEGAWGMVGLWAALGAFHWLLLRREIRRMLERNS